MRVTNGVAENEMSKTKFNIATLLMIYVGLIGSLALVAWVGINHVTAAASPPFERRSQVTVLDQRIASAREIREALSKPLPQAEPLPPISTKLVNPNAAAPHEPKSNTLSPEAMNAMAMGQPRTVAESWCFTNPASCQRPTASRQEQITASPL